MALIGYYAFELLLLGCDRYIELLGNIHDFKQHIIHQQNGNGTAQIVWEKIPIAVFSIRNNIDTYIPAQDALDLERAFTPKASDIRYNFNTQTYETD